MLSWKDTAVKKSKPLVMATWPYPVRLLNARITQNKSTMDCAASDCQRGCSVRPPNGLTRGRANPRAPVTVSALTFGVRMRVTGPISVVRSRSVARNVRNEHGSTAYRHVSLVSRPIGRAMSSARPCKICVMNYRLSCKSVVVIGSHASEPDCSTNDSEKRVALRARHYAAGRKSIG